MIIDFNRYNGGGGSTSAVTPEQVQEQINSALTPYWDSAVTESAITEAVSGLATEQYVQDALSGVSLEGYWTSAETKTYVDSAVTDTQNQLNEISGMMQSKELVISTAFNQLSDDIAELSAATPSTEEIELPIAAAVNDLKGNIEARLDQQYYKKAEVDNIAARKMEIEQVDVHIENYVKPTIAEVNDTIEDKELPVSAAINDLNTNKVSGVGITKIQSISQADYDALTVKDPATLYIIKD